MCLIFLSVQNHPVYKLIVAANRDEFYNRQSAPAAFWEDHPHILGGRDLVAGGTWMAMTQAGKISMITNYRDPENIRPKAPSRGHLVSDYLADQLDPDAYMHKVAEYGSRYNGFNLITGTVDALYYYSNYGDGIQRLTPGVYGLSNHLLNTPWPKVKRGVARFKETYLTQPSIEPDQLLDMLYDDRIATDEELPETGVSKDWERLLSSMFIKSPSYGSRCSTVVLVDKDNQVTFVERTYDIATFEFSTLRFTFKINRQ